MLFLSLIVLFSYSLVAMEAPHESHPRRPLEESFFELHAQTDQRLRQMNQRLEQIEVRTDSREQRASLNAAVDSGVEKVKRATGDAQLQSMILNNEARVAAFAREQQAHNRQTSENMQLLQERERRHEAAQNQQREQLQQLRLGNERLAAELEAQKSINKKMYIAGGIISLATAVGFMYLGSYVAQHNRELHRPQEDHQTDVKSLTYKVAALESRPYVTKDKNNALVYNAPTGSDPVKGAHVSHW